MSQKWMRCTRKHPCPICGKPDWCVYLNDGSIVLCMRKENGHPSSGDAGGWVYRMGTEGVCHNRPSTIYEEKPHIPQKSVEALMSEWTKDTPGIWLATFAKELGVTRASLERIGCAWCAGQSCWAFPMRDAAGSPVGIRLRSQTRKYSVTGSRTGLFFDPGTRIRNPDVAWLTEGPTDTAAILSIRPQSLVIGRSDLLSAWKPLKAALEQRNVSCVNICVDDESEQAGRTTSPGRSGSLRLAKTLGLPCKFVHVPGFKDIRDFVRHGGTKKELEEILSMQSFKVVK